MFFISIFNKVALRLDIINPIGCNKNLFIFVTLLLQTIDFLIPYTYNLFKSFRRWNKFNIKRLRYVFKFHETLNNARSREREGVILSTIHGVKGMEFKNVYLVNCNEDTIPHSSSKEENIEEERRLFYVGITRAIDNLYLFAPKNRRGQLKEISRFICESEFDKLPKDTYGYKVDDNISQKTYGLGKIKSIEDDKVTISFEDGVNRSFSLKVLAENDLIQKII